MLQEHFEFARRDAEGRARVLLAVEDLGLRRRLSALLQQRYSVEPAAGWVRGSRACVELVIGDAEGLRALRGQAQGLPVLPVGEDCALGVPLRPAEVLERVALQLEVARLRAQAAGRERELEERLGEAARRLAFVTAASRALGAVLDVDVTLGAVAKVAVPGLAQWCVIDLLDQSRLVRKAAWHQDPSRAALLEHLDAGGALDDRRHPVHRALVTGNTETAGEVPVDFAKRLARTPEHLEALRELDIGTYICVPLRLHGTIAGVLMLGGDSRWPAFTPGDTALAQDLAARTGAAIERARLYEEAQAELLERRRVETELRRQQEHEHLILGTIDAMVWYKDTENRVLRVNRAAAEWTGQPRERIEGRRADEIFGPETGRRYFEHDRAVIAGGTAVRDFERVKMPDGRERWLQRDTIPQRDESGRIKGVIILAVDVTEQKLVEQMLRANESAQREFVANVSHEFRTPVTAIKGFAQTLRSGAVRSSGERERFLAIIERNADRLNALVEELLTLSALEDGGALRRKAVDVRGAAVDCVERLSEEARRARVSLSVSVRERLEALCDPLHLSQIIENLVANAIRFNRPQGSVRVRAERRDAAALICVEDTGIGILPEHLARVFERFYRVEKGATPGRTGLGLHIVQRLAREHGGKAWAQSEVGAGSSFYVELPLAPSCKSDGAAAAPGHTIGTERRTNMTAAQPLCRPIVPGPSPQPMRPAPGQPMPSIEPPTITPQPLRPAPSPPRPDPPQPSQPKQPEPGPPQPLG